MKRPLSLVSLWEAMAASNWLLLQIVFLMQLVFHGALSFQDFSPEAKIWERQHTGEVFFGEIKDGQLAPIL